jgi:hypothetical protein
MTKAELKKLNLPIRAHNGKVAFDFTGSPAFKLRGNDDGQKKKDIAWVNDGSRPELWPVPITPGKTITVTEGEFDTICLRKSGIESYSITAGAGTPIDQATWEVLYELGVEVVQICFDVDREGRKGRDLAVQDAQRAGLSVRPMRPDGINPLIAQTDVRDAVFAQGYPVRLVDDVTEAQAVSIDTIEPATEDSLLLGWLHPNEHTIMFGDGGTGKGVIAAQFAVELARSGKTLLIVDYEQHARHEWRPRISRFSCPHGNADASKDRWLQSHRDKPCKESLDVMQQIFYVQPTEPLWDIQGWLRSEAQRVGADYLIIDSVTYACGGLEPEKSVTAVKYTQAINAVGFPALSIGHVTKSDADPRHPFGSVYWHNGARVTIGVSRRDGDDPISDRILKHRKANQGQHQHDVALDWTWLDTGLPPGGLQEKRAYANAAAAFDALLAETGQIPSKAEVEEAWGSDIEQAAYNKTVRSRKGLTVTKVSRSAPSDVGSEADDEPTD